MTDALSEMLMQAYNEPDTKPYLFQIGQKVRIRTGRSLDGQTPPYWDGATGKILSRKCSWLHKDHWYKILHDTVNFTCEFREDELDLRFSRKNK